MNIQDFITKYLNKKVSFHNDGNFQCVDLARQWIAEGLNLPEPLGVVGAKDFWSNYKIDENLYLNFHQIPNTLTFVPQAGDIMIWKWGKYGHIAVCTGKGNVLWFEVLSQNDPTNSPCILKKYSYIGVLGVFRPKTHILTPADIPNYTNIEKRGVELWGFTSNLLYF